MGPIVQHMTALAEAFEVGQPVVRGIAIQVGSGQHNAGMAKPGGFHQVGPARRAAMPIPPGPRLLIKPPTVRQAPELD